MKDPGYGLMFLAIPRVVLLLLECAYHPAGSNLEHAEMMLVEPQTVPALLFLFYFFFSFLFLSFSLLFHPYLGSPYLHCHNWFLLPSGTAARRILFIGTL